MPGRLGSGDTEAHGTNSLELQEEGDLAQIPWESVGYAEAVH